MNTEELSEKLRKILMPKKEIVAAYLYGSMAKGLDKKNSDIDIGLLVDREFRAPPLYEAGLSLEIGKFLKTRNNVDVRVLNNREVTFSHQVLKHGKLLFCRDEKEKILFETGVYSQYLDFKPFFLQYNEIRKRRVLA